MTSGAGIELGGGQLLGAASNASFRVHLPMAMINRLQPVGQAHPVRAVHPVRAHGGNSFAAPIPVTDTERFRTERLVPRSWQAPVASSQRANSAAVLRISR